MLTKDQSTEEQSRAEQRRAEQRRKSGRLSHIKQRMGAEPSRERAEERELSRSRAHTEQTRAEHQRSYSFGRD
jgi:hypothetical protein